MIKFALDRILFENDRMKIPELQEKSGVNKNTLYSIYNNSSTRVDLSVLDRICTALKCQPGNLLEHIPDQPEELSQATEIQETKEVMSLKAATPTKAKTQ